MLVDFDGTIATVDTTDLLLERFADPGWRSIEEQWKAGRIGSRECMLRQIDLVRATPAEMDAFVADLEIDPGFQDFVELCEAESCELLVVSDGLDRTVGAVLARHGLDLAYRANRLSQIGADRWRLDFPYATAACRSLSGNCKCRFAEAPAGTVRVVVGDGRSDFCVAGEAELVFAKASLLRHCEAEALAHFSFESFTEVASLFRTWLDTAAAETSEGPDAMRDE